MRDAPRHGFASRDTVAGSLRSAQDRLILSRSSDPKKLPPDDVEWFLSKVRFESRARFQILMDIDGN